MRDEGLLTLSESEWNEAKRRAEIIRPLAVLKNLLQDKDPDVRYSLATNHSLLLEFLLALQQVACKQDFSKADILVVVGRQVL